MKSTADCINCCHYFIFSFLVDLQEQNLRGEISLFQMNMVLASEEKIGHPNGLQLIFPETKGQNTRLIYLYAELAKVTTNISPDEQVGKLWKAIICKSKNRWLLFVT